jgi:hypothetical protein
MKLGINALGGVYCPCGSAAAPCKGGPLNATQDLQALSPHFARTHDAKLLNPTTYDTDAPWGIPTLNWNNFYPALSANPEDPASYDWTTTDAFIGQFDALGIPLLLRLGDSWMPTPSASNISLQAAGNLSTAFVNLVRHVNDGWPKQTRGDRAAKRVKYVEVWNEPEGTFWSGSLPAFYSLLTQTIQKLRAYDPDLRVGPNNAAPFGQSSGTLPVGYELTALDAVLAATPNVSLWPNVYSWHEYIDQYPTLTETLFNKTREALEQRNLSGSTEQIITEWNPCASGSCKPPYQLDAWAAADFAQTVLVHATLGVTASAPYPLCAVNTDWGLLSTTSAQGKLVWRPQAFAFQMMSTVLHDTPHVWVAGLFPSRDPPQSPDHKYFTAAFSSADLKRFNIVHVSRMQAAGLVRPEILIRLRGLPPGVTFEARAFVISNGSPPQNNEPVGVAENVTVDSHGELQMPHSYPSATPSVLRVELIS